MVDRVFGFMVGVRDRFVKEGSLETVEEVVTMFREAFDKRAITHPTMPRFFVLNSIHRCGAQLQFQNSRLLRFWALPIRIHGHLQK